MTRAHAVIDVFRDDPSLFPSVSVMIRIRGFVLQGQIVWLAHQAFRLVLTIPLPLQGCYQILGHSLSLSIVQEYFGPAVGGYGDVSILLRIHCRSSDTVKTYCSNQLNISLLNVNHKRSYLAPILSNVFAFFAENRNCPFQCADSG